MAKESNIDLLSILQERIQDQIETPEERVDGDLPLTELDTFLYHKDYLNLPFKISDIQKDFLLALSDDFSDPSTSRYSTYVLKWGKGCISGDTVIDGVGKTIEQLYKEKKPIEVLSYNETTNKVEKITTKEAPFIEGVDYHLYEIELDDGRKITATPEHIFYNEKGETFLKDLKIGDSLRVLIEESSVFSQKLMKIKKITYKGTGKFYSMYVPDMDYSKGNHNYFANGILNHNGGKDFIAGVSALWIIHRLLCYQDPRKTLREASNGKISIAPGDYIDILNVAINAEQAKSVYFDKLCGLLKQAGYKAFKQFGFDYVKHVTSSVVIFPKELRIISGNSRQESLEGKNLIMATLDEIACAHYSTPVLLSNGKTELIGKIVNNKVPVEVVTFNFEKNIFENKKVSQFYKYPRTTPFIKIYTNRCTYKRTESILLTPNHWVFTENKGKIQVKDLCIGDKLMRKGLFFNNFQKQFLLGTLLGDGCFSRGRTPSPMFCWTHSRKQEGYMYHKEKILGVFTNGYKVTKPAGYLNTPQLHMSTKNISDFSVLEEICLDKKTSKKRVTKEWAQKLDEVSLAFWYLDDGSITKNKNSLSFSTNSFTEQEIKYLCEDSILKRYEPKYYKTKKGIVIYINKKQNTINFMNDIKKYLPKSMAYKTIFEEEELVDEYYDNNPIEYGGVPIYKLEEIKEKKGRDSNYVYDIGVEDNHNYLVGATHNIISNSFKTKDELKGKKGLLSAEDMYDVLRTSINTRFPTFGKLVMISYPRHKRDFLMNFYAESEQLLKENPTLGIYLSTAATWEANPTKSKYDKAIADDYIKNPEKAAQFYECIAPDTEDPFFKHKDKIHRVYESLQVRNPYNISGGYSNDFRAKPFTYVIHLDLAYSGDRATLALSHVEGEAEDRVFFCDLIKYWEAELNKEIDLESIEQEIIFLRQRGFNIIDVSYDNASLSKYLIQRLEKAGFNTTYITVDRNIAPYMSLKDLIYSDKVRTYYEPILIDELLCLSVINGNKIEHTTEGVGKDLSDAFCGSIYNLLIKKINNTKRYFRTF